MEIEKRVEDLETEFKLIKGEVKQSLADIRDFVLTGDLAPQVTSLPETAAEKTPQVQELDTTTPPAPKPCGDDGAYEQIEEIVDELIPGGGEERLEEAAPIEPTLLDETSKPPGEQAAHEEPDDIAVEKLPKESKEEDMTEKANGSILQANQLPNLIRWVSVAKKEIGAAQLPTFLEAYGIRGHLSSEMKEIILRLAVVVSEQSGEPSSADLWSRLTLELHGILSDGSAR